ncbi:BglG family transcription antiterminator [Streptococcus oricebi]|uniref:Ascorbate 6-phosphate lactonase n=1 Tax=Streptococcus oricebi TaxID=1547447 RepID=A0ABS5B6Q4_9STRE|nr:transcription antiterminator [Streptococcus oricebi]MBP2623674.1 ascorbate 6-phosphate lactonase [Streptococcus oricebi]
MLLNKNSCTLLRYLLELEEPETIMEISRNTGQSRRKIYYHLDKINDALPQGVDKIVSRPRVGLLLTAGQRLACQSLLNQIDSYSYVLSMEERMQLIILFVCVLKERVTIEKLIELTEVSRNTVLNDLNTLRNQLAVEQYQVSLITTKSQGYVLKCHPLNKVQYVHALLTKIFLEGTTSFIRVLEDKIRAYIQDDLLLSKVLQGYLSQQVHFIEQDLGKKINRYELEFMLRILPYLLLSYRNMVLSEQAKSDLKREFSLIRKRVEYRTAQKLQELLNQKLGLKLDEIEVSWIAILLLSYRKDQDIHATSQDFADLRVAVDNFIWQFEAHSPYELENKENLARNLMIHCKALLFRKTYGILSKNPLTRHIIHKYPELYAYTEKNVSILEEAWLISLTRDEIAYLAMHLGGALKHQAPEQKKTKQVYIVCDEGIAVQRLLLKQCQSYFPADYIRAVFTSEQYKSVEDLLEADLVIVTSDGLNSKFPLLQVKPILDYEDALKLKRFANYDLLDAEHSDFRSELERLLSHYLSNKEEAQELQYQIENLVEKQILTDN